MDANEVEARLSVIETFSMMSLGLYLANASNDPDFQKAAALLQALKESVASLPLRPEVKSIANSYAEELVEALRMNLRSMRGHGGQPH